MYQSAVNCNRTAIYYSHAVYMHAVYMKTYIQQWVCGTRWHTDNTGTHRHTDSTGCADHTDGTVCVEHADLWTLNTKLIEHDEDAKMKKKSFVKYYQLVISQSISSSKIIVLTASFTRLCIQVTQDKVTR